MGVDCQIEFYLDRDLQGITCEAVARYGDFVFQLVPTAKALRGVINPDSRSKAALIKRDTGSRIIRGAGGSPAFPDMEFH